MSSAWKLMDEPAYERPSTGDSRHAWDSSAAGYTGPFMEEDNNSPAAMQAEMIVDGNVVLKNGNDNEVEVEEPTQGCWYKFKAGLRSVWATRHTEDTRENRELYIKTTLRELVVYLLFLIILMIVAYGMTSLTTFYYTKVLSDLFLKSKFSDKRGSFKDSTTIDDFWKFARGPLLSGIYWDTWYNKQNVSEMNYIYYENKLLGVPRIRQLKVRNDSCNIPKDFQADIKECFATYSFLAEEKRSFGVMNSTAWNYTSPEQIDAEEFNGLMSSYGAGGYYLDLKQSRGDTEKLISHLWTNLWIDRGTRVVVIDFTVYNANINQFCVVKYAYKI